MVKRFEHFNDLLFDRYEAMKAAYVELGGVYHGDSDEEKEDDVVDGTAVEEKKADVELDCDKHF